MRERSALAADERGHHASGRASDREYDRGRSGNGRAFILILKHVAGDGVMGCENVDGVGIEDGRVLLGSLTLRVRKRLTVVLTAASIG